MINNNEAAAPLALLGVAEGVAETLVLNRLVLMGLLVIVIEFEACEITVEVVVADGDGVSGKSTTLILIGNQQSCSYLDNSEGTIEICQIQ